MVKIASCPNKYEYAGNDIHSASGTFTSRDDAAGNCARAISLRSKDIVHCMCHNE